MAQAVIPLPKKSNLPTGTPSFLKMSYAVMTWKKKFGRPDEPPSSATPVPQLLKLNSLALTKALQIRHARELELVRPGLKRHLLVVFALEILAARPLQRLHRLLDPLAQLRVRRLVVGHGHVVLAGQAREHGFGRVAGGLDLEFQRKHVSDQTRFDERVGRDFLLVGPFLALLEDCEEVLEGAEEGWLAVVRGGGGGLLGEMLT